MIELRESVHIDTSAEQAWAVLIDWDHQHEWMLGTRVRATEQDGRGVGGGLHAVTGLGRIGMPDTMRIVGWDPPHRCDVVHTGQVVRGSASFTVTECDRPAGGVGASGGVVVAWSETLDLPLAPLTERLWPLLRPAVVLPFRISLRRFARLARERSR